MTPLAEYENEIGCLRCGIHMSMVGTISDPRIGSVRFETQEIRVNERVKHHFAKPPFDAAEPLRLRGCQLQAGHFQVFGADACEYYLVRHGDVSSSPA
jgi:hypothetical protein